MTIDEKIQQALNAPDDCGYARLAKDLARFLQESRATAAAVTSASDDGWIPWAGGYCPVGGGTRVLVRLRDGWQASVAERAAVWAWDDYHSSSDIVAYKVVA